MDSDSALTGLLKLRQCTAGLLVLVTICAMRKIIDFSSRDIKSSQVLTIAFWTALLSQALYNLIATFSIGKRGLLLIPASPL